MRARAKQSNKNVIFLMITGFFLLPWLTGASVARAGEGHLDAGSKHVETRWAQVRPALRRPPPPRSRRAPEAQRVRVKLMAVHASNALKGIAPELRRFQRQLAVLNYRGFRLLFTKNLTLRPGSPRSVGLMNGRSAELTLQSLTSTAAILRLRLFSPPAPRGVAVDTIVTVPRNRTFFLAGPRYDGGILILPISASW